MYIRHQVAAVAWPHVAPSQSKLRLRVRTVQERGRFAR